jgi:hypothetical protein
MRKGTTAGFILLFAVLSLGSICNDHVGGKPNPTPDPGGLLVLPKEASHSPPTCSGDEPNEPEPNGTLFTAVQLGRQACTAGIITKIPGRLASSDDIDIYALPMNSGCPLPFLSEYDPFDRRTELPRVDFTGDDQSVICLFASCDYGPTTLDGCPAGITQHLEEGMLGCCRTGSGTLVTNVSCDSYAPSVSGFILVSSVGTNCHADYEIDFSIAKP